MKSVTSVPPKSKGDAPLGCRRVTNRATLVNHPVAESPAPGTPGRAFRLCGVEGCRSRADSVSGRQEGRRLDRRESQLGSGNHSQPRCGRRKPGPERPLGMAENESREVDVSSSLSARESDSSLSGPGTCCLCCTKRTGRCLRLPLSTDYPSERGHAHRLGRGSGGMPAPRIGERSARIHLGARRGRRTGARSAGALRDGNGRGARSSGIGSRDYGLGSGSGSLQNLTPYRLPPTPSGGVGRLDDTMRLTR